MSSTPSTPRTTRTASRANSPNAAAANDDNMMLTPGRKIKAMMAAFDSDSESENESAQQKPDRSTTTLSNALKHSTISTQPTNPADSDDDDSEDDEDIVMPKGRMAARLQGHTQNQSEGQTAFERVSKTLRTEKKEEDDDVVMDDEDEDEDEDDLPTAGPRRRGRNTADLVPEVEMDERHPARSESPLFVSSPGRGQDDEDGDQAGSGNDEEAQPKANSRFLALVAQKRKEREEKEKAEAEKRAARAKQQEQFSSEILSGSESEGENGSGRKLTQQASRPARKASKKALEEMNRETQRMSRNMQLAHQAQTKKKITKESFFARFNAVKSDERTAPGAPGENSSTTADSLNSSDAEVQKEKETPRTSPVLGPVEKEAGDGLDKEVETEFRPLEDILENPRPQAEQPVVARMEIDEAHTTQPGKTPSKKERKELTGPPVRVRLTREEVARQQKDDSDSELEIVTSPAKCRRIAAFENVPARKAQEPASMMKLKALAHITSPTRKSAMHPAQLSATVLLKAKQQAARERQQRIEELKAKGIHIETAEERAAMEDELENLVQKARKEAEDIAKIERKAAKGGDEDDEDWDYSGSEEEAEEDEDEEEDEEDKPAGEDGLVDSEAGEGDESEDDQTETMSVDENDAPTQRRKRPTRVVLDDEDDEDEEIDPKTPAKSIVTPTTRSVERPQLPTQSSSNLMSLTQAFAGTISGSHQDNAQSGSTIPYSAPDPDPMVEDREPSDSQTIIRDSQEPRKGSVDLLAGYAQSDSRISESPAPRSTQLSEMPDPTQDAGFVFSPFDPNKRFLGTPQSTIDTVVINRDNQDGSPAPARRMKQLKRGRAADLSMIEEQEENDNEGDFEIDASAFDVMKKATKKPAVPFDRKKSKAKEIVEEAAEESDDEYAGLGGASDEDDDEAENAYDRQMINDNSGETVDEKQLAALNALHQRTNDEKQVAKLLKDITTGALRRRRNADDEFDLDDSDDELLARRREKQREFARMRKALLADEKIGEIAENPKKAAFFRAVEDRDDDDDDVGFDFLDEPQESTQTDDPSSQDNTTPNDNTTTNNNTNTRKRPLDHTTDPSDPQSLPPRPPPHLRRTKPVSAMSKKPATLAEIRETLSFLTETHDYDSFHEDASIDMDDMDMDMDMENDTDEDGDDPLSTTAHQQDGAQEPQPKDQQQQQQPLPPSQRQHPRRTRGPVVDRLALLRQASSNSANTNSTTTTNSSGATVPAPGGNRMAFHSGSSGAAELSGFARPPPLVRRTTASSTGSSTSIGSMSSRTSKGTGSSLSSTSKSGNVSSAGKGGGKSGAVNYYTAARERERERQLRVQERGGREGNMKALVEKHARNRLGALGKGQWE
ncbi:hypothetical protein ASPFODRAFT_153227 [Aspergillus luchuensis CBS 106.47]|uniref:DNA replication checkpoint mediator MRC1 domain-containing protein n=1 Tax=Aspergillus luchuensis (strain CBS 106.47) TaxID=1137211 RepID=A0A1M3TVI5_ASPLC|nr:hypothetical protein ASPFODRAFT_153227 [Aspergillus luchuensis CBS 106.47]